MKTLIHQSELTTYTKAVPGVLSKSCDSYNNQDKEWRIQKKKYFMAY
jgi:hypothetical protein